jgi:predicted transcriptional regulator
MKHRDGTNWTYLTNHSHVLICLYRDPHMRLRDVADLVGVTERAVQMIVHDLEDAGVVSHRRDGRRNVYNVDLDHELRHPVEAHRTVRDLVSIVAPEVGEHADA